MEVVDAKPIHLPARFSLRKSAFVVGSCVLLLGGMAKGHGDYHDVVERLLGELRADGTNAALRYQLAEAHAGHENWRACLKELELVEKAAPGKHPVGYLRGFALEGAGWHEAAVTELDAFLLKTPEHGDALFTRGRALAAMERWSEAVASLQKAFDLAQSPNADLTMALAKCLAAQGKDQEASAVINRGLKTVGNTPSLLLCALEFETKARRWDDALGRIAGLEKLAPTPEPWMARRAALLSTAGRNAESLAAWLALRDRLLALPNLERGSATNLQLLREARRALGESSPAPVSAPPLPPT